MACEICSEANCKACSDIDCPDTLYVEREDPADQIRPGQTTRLPDSPTDWTDLMKRVDAYSDMLDALVPLDTPGSPHGHPNTIIKGLTGCSMMSEFNEEDHEKLKKILGLAEQGHQAIRHGQQILAQATAIAASLLSVTYHVSLNEAMDLITSNFTRLRGHKVVPADLQQASDPTP